MMEIISCSCVPCILIVLAWQQKWRWICQNSSKNASLKYITPKCVCKLGELTLLKKQQQQATPMHFFQIMLRCLVCAAVTQPLHCYLVKLELSHSGEFLLLVTKSWLSSPTVTSLAVSFVYVWPIVRQQIRDIQGWCHCWQEASGGDRQGPKQQDRTDVQRSGASYRLFV